MIKEAVKQYWDNEPCGTRGVPYVVGSMAYYDTISERRDELDWYIPEYAQFDKWKGKKVLEVGCGVGSDLIRFAQDGAQVYGIDLSPKSVILAKGRLHLYKCVGTVVEGDAEHIPYQDNSFAFVYSWGVAHHTPNIEKAIKEIYRVTKSGGEICIMLYHRHSIVALQMWLLFGLLKGKPWRNISDILANHHESEGTKAYTIKEVRQLFSIFDNLRVDVRVSSYDIRYARDRYLPRWVARILPQGIGWNIIVRAGKP